MEYMEYLMVKMLYGVACFLRWLYLSSKFGFTIYNFVVSGFSRLVNSQPMEPIYIGRNFAGFQFQRRFYQLTPSVRRRMIESLIWSNLIGFLRRKRLKKRGMVVPSNIVISPTYRCNLNCCGCYARGHRGELSFETLKKIMTEQENLGIFSVYLTGGEPFTRNDLWQIFEMYPRTTFTVYTNGTLIGKKEVERIAQLGNIRLMVSLEGFREFTDKRRGKGIYNRVINLLKLCRETNIFYGLSITVAKENFKEVTSQDFLEGVSNWRPLLVNYFMYMRFGNEDFPTPISNEQALELDQWCRETKTRYPFFVILGRNGSNLVDKCVVAERRIHITANGDVEPCVFCHWAADNIKEKSILEVMNSEFFRLIRGLNSLGDSELNPCKITDSCLLLNLFQTSGAKLTK